MRSRRRAKREREEEERGHCRQPMSFDFAGDPETSCHEPRSSFNFDFESHPLTSPANPEARIAVRLRVRIAPFDFAG